MYTIATPDYPTQPAVQHGAWLRQFAAQLPTLATRCGLTTSEVLEVQQLVRLYRTWLRSHLLAQEVPKAVGNFILLQVRQLTERLCQHPSFSMADVHLLNLQRAPWDLKLPSFPTPQLSAILYQGKRVVVLWNRRRMAKLCLQVCRDGSNWCDIAINQPKSGRVSDTLPTLTLPMLWHYRARYYEADDSYGEWSEPLCVMVQPMAKGTTSPIVFPKVS